MPPGIAGSSTILARKKFRYMFPPIEGTLRNTP